MSTSSNVTVPVVSVIVTRSASTVDWKVVPPELVIITAPMSVPTAPLTVAVPVVSIVTCSPTLPVVPVIEPTWIVLATPVPSVRVAVCPSSTSASVMLPVEAPPMAAAPTTVTSVSRSPSVITPVVAAIVAEIEIAAGAVATTPPANVNVSPPVSPNWRAPVLRNSVTPAMAFEPLLPPRSFRAYGWAAVTRPVVRVTTPASRT